MTSAIDPSKPTAHQALTADVRANFQTAANEITALQNVTIGGPYLTIAGGHISGPGNLTMDGDFRQLQASENGWSIFGNPIFVSSMDGGLRNGAVFYYYQNIPPNTNSEPVALEAYGELAAVSTGNLVFGLGALAKALPGVTAGVVVGAEITAHNDSGHPPDSAVPPHLNTGTTAIAAQGLQVTCGGANDCTTGITIEAEGGASTKWQTLLYGANYAQFGLYIEAAAAGLYTYTGYLKNNGTGVNLVLSTTGAMTPGNAVIDVVDNGGASHFLVNQNGDTTLTGQMTVGPSGGYGLLKLQGGHNWQVYAGPSQDFNIQDLTIPALRLQISNAGACSASSAWGIISDANLKTDIVDHPHGLAEILQLQPRRFTYNGKQGLQGDGSGLVAQELESVMPELVRDMSTGDGGTVKTVVETGILWPLVNAVKELAAQNAALTERLAALEAKLGA